MQSSLEFFCEECGAANPGDATYCFACKEPLSHSSDSLPVKPIVVAPSPVLQVTVGSALATSEPSQASSEALKPDTVLHKRYRIRSEIGRGGYSIVYKASDMRSRNRLICIKQINLRNLTARQMIEATETFNRETSFLPILRCEGIPRFITHFADPEHWYLVMEYIPGQTLEDYLQNSTTGGYCSLVETLKIGIGLSTILGYLHTRKYPLIFRDLKPSNVIITRRKKLYLIDFGITRAFNPGKSRDTTPLGSPGYAAPEQYGRGQSDIRTDIYGLGATLQTLLTGREPLELRAGEPSRSPQPIPRRVQKLLDEMTDPNANRRPRNMAVVRQHLKDALGRKHRLSSYVLGLGLGLIFILWFYLNLILGYGYSYYPLWQASGCLWGISFFTTALVLFVFLFIPTKRYISFGALTIVLILVFLLWNGILPATISPFSGQF